MNFSHQPSIRTSDPSCRRARRQRGWTIMKNMKRRLEMFRSGHLPPGAPTRVLVDDLWQKYERVVKELRKISVPLNNVGSSCQRCGTRWSEGKKEHHAQGCVLEGTEP